MTKTFKKLAFQCSEKPSAKAAKKALISLYGNVEPSEADAIIPLGGDGFMLETLMRNMPLIRRGLPVYGMNRGTVGFLMNSYSEDDLPARLAAAAAAVIHPLKMTATGAKGTVSELAFNEVSLFRQTRQARRWRGALVKADAKVVFDVLNPTKRPVSATADNIEYRDITRVAIEQDTYTSLTLLFDPDHGLDEKILREQFAT